MANFSGSGLPRRKQDWEARLKQNGLSPNNTIYDYRNAKSASDIEIAQYLLLRVLHDSDASDLTKKVVRDKLFGEENIDNARKELRDLPSWNVYLECLEDPKYKGYVHPIPKDLGVFSLVYYYQQQIITGVNGNNEYSSRKLDFTPVSARLRGKEPPAAASPSTPTPASREKQSPKSTAAEKGENIVDSIEQLDLSSLDTPKSDLFSISPLSPATRDDAAFFHAIKDEQIVNTYLLLLLQATSIHCDHLSPQWTIHRRPFQFKSKSATTANKVFEARVDGYLRMQDDKAGALIEVKPCLRRTRPDQIRMQEAAQLASWICDQPPPREDLQAGKKFRRLLISQDRHEIYLSFAEFDADYVAYVCNLQHSKLSFLEIKEFGPFAIHMKKHIDIVAHLLLAYMMKVSG